MTNETPQPLNLSVRFFAYLRSENIRYCHWKSNIRLSEALAGETDLDILIHAEDKERFAAALKYFDFITILAAPESSHPGLENALGLDFETGKLLHLHIHYRLVLGEMYIKNHHLPIETFIFQHCRYISGVCVPIPEIELFLLIIRAHMKLTGSAILRRIVIGKKLLYPPDILSEIYYLINSCRQERFNEIVRKSGLPLSALFMKKTFELFAYKNATPTDTIQIRRKIFQNLAPYRIQPAISSKFRYLWRLFRRNSLLNLVFPGNLCRLPSEGRMVALVGADGAGKSTFAEDLSRWLSWRLRVNNIYFGGPKSGLCPILMLVERVLNILGNFFRKTPLKGFCDYARKWFGIYRLLLASRARRRLYWKALKKVGQGEIVVFDRYPLPEFNSLRLGLDGAEIRKVYGTMGSKIADMEENVFSFIGQPDLAIFLKVPLSELRSRKPDVPALGQHKLTVDSLQNIQGRNGLVIVNGQKAYTETLSELKQLIWKEMLIKKAI